MDRLKHSFLFNLLLVILSGFALYIIFFYILHHATQHGEEYELPDVTGKTLNTAIADLEHLHFTISVDSTFEPSMKPGTVMRQIPAPTSIVKEGRIVLLTVNMVSPPDIHMPGLVNLSLHNAEILLRNHKLVLGDTIYKPSNKAGVVMKQLYMGYEIKQGALIPQGSSISLQIGDGMGNTELLMPDVLNINCEMAQAILINSGLQVEIVLKNKQAKITDSMSAMVVGQIPDANANVKIGDKTTLVIE